MLQARTRSPLAKLTVRLSMEHCAPLKRELEQLRRPRHRPRRTVLTP
jgi:hypothetical protein